MHTTVSPYIRVKTDYDISYDYICINILYEYNCVNISHDYNSINISNDCNWLWYVIWLLLHHLITIVHIYIIYYNCINLSNDYNCIQISDNYHRI